MSVQMPTVHAPEFGSAEHLRTLKTRIRASLLADWDRFGYFPCRLALDLRGDPSVRFRDILSALRSPLPPPVKAAIALCWPLRAARVLWPPRRDGISLPVPTSGARSVRFRTPFVDSYMYFTARDVLRDATLPSDECDRWGRVLLDLVAGLIDNPVVCRADQVDFPTFVFARPGRHAANGRRPIDFLFRAIWANPLPDNDTAFVGLEVLHDFARSFHQWPIEDEALRDVGQSLLARAARILDFPFWRLARAYQFREDGTRWAPLNWTDTDPLGGVTAYFGSALVESPDPTPNVNVLRSLLAMADWNESPEAVETLRGIVAFLGATARSSTFELDRGHVYYLPEFCCAMVGSLWRSLEAMPASVRTTIDPEGDLEVLRAAALTYVRTALDPDLRAVNALDGALGMLTLALLGAPDERLFAGWLRVITQSSDEGRQAFGAYEAFKGKVPTLAMLGSEALTGGLVYQALAAMEPYCS